MSTNRAQPKATFHTLLKKPFDSHDKSNSKLKLNQKSLKI